MPRVFILSDGGHDYSAAAEFGELVYCTHTPIHRDDVAQMYRELKVSLDEATYDDFILISGLTSLCCVATAIMAERFSEVHFLIFKSDRYIRKDLFLDNTGVQ